MPTGVLTPHTPHTPHHPYDTPQTVSADARLTPDEVVERILTRVKSPLGEGEVRTLIETLEKVSRTDLPPMNRRIQPVDNRCCNPTTKSARV